MIAYTFFVDDEDTKSIDWSAKESKQQTVSRDIR